jgi:hypothetical protein
MPLKVLRGFYGGPTIEGKILMSPQYMGERRSDGLPNEAHRFWRPLRWVPQAGCSIMADHSGLYLDALNGSTDNNVAVQQARFVGRSNQLWTFVPDNKGFNFIVNLCSGQVLDVANKSLNNHATVQQHPFNGGDNQR